MLNNIIENQLPVAIKDMIYGHGEFEHLKAFLNDYIHDKYNLWIAKGDTDYIVMHMTNSHHPYHHHSFSNCVEWVFKNAKLDKETD